MRRRLHGVLVGVLTCSLAFDTAQACGHRRCFCHVRPCLAVPSMSSCAVACPQPAWTVVRSAPWCPPVVTAWEPCGVWIVGSGPAGCCAGEPIIGAETRPVETPVVEASPPSVEVEPAATQPIVAESIVAPAVEPAAGLVPLAPAPDLQAVEPASATEPAGDVELPPAEPPVAAVEPAPTEAPQEPVAAEPPPVATPAAPEPPAAEAPGPAPEEENLFEEVAREPDATDSSAVPAVEPPPAVAEPVEPAAVSEPDPPAAETEPAAAEPGEPAIAPEPEAEQAAPEAAATEPPRRWIDASGRYATVGVLVAVRGAAIEIRTASGRSITVPLERLSEFDRGYADAAAVRLAARGPGAGDTAGL